MKRLFLLLTAVLIGTFSANAQKEEPKISAFKNIIITYPAKVEIVYSPQYSVEIDDSSGSKIKVLIFEETENSEDKTTDLGRFSLKEKDSTLYIERKADISTDFGRVKIIIKTPRLETIHIETATSVNISGNFDLDKVNFEIEGASSINFTGEAKIKRLSVKNKGASYLYLSLKHPIEVADLDIEGASYFSALETPIRRVIAKVEGASICKVYPLEELNVKVEGMSYILYKGNPIRDHIKSEGLSIIKRAD